MDPQDIDRILDRHHRQRVFGWLCACGHRYPCGMRTAALDAQQRQGSVEAGQWYVDYFRAHPDEKPGDPS